MTDITEVAESIIADVLEEADGDLLDVACCALDALEAAGYAVVKLPESQGPWGPGSLEDYAKLSGQQECSAVEAFNIFIRRNLPVARHAHLLDSDDNDGQFVRDVIEAEVEQLRDLDVCCEQCGGGCGMEAQR